MGWRCKGRRRVETRDADIDANGSSSSNRVDVTSSGIIWGCGAQLLWRSKYSMQLELKFRRQTCWRTSQVISMADLTFYSDDPVSVAIANEKQNLRTFAFNVRMRAVDSSSPRWGYWYRTHSLSNKCLITCGAEKWNKELTNVSRIEFPLLVLILLRNGMESWARKSW